MDGNDRIIVGVDGSSAADEALRWAAQEGRLRGVEVCAMLAWSFLDQHVVPGGDGFSPHYVESDAKAALAAYVARALGTGEHRVRQCVVNDRPATALLVAAKNAALLVVGARGFGGFRGLLFGSVSHRCAHLTSTPLVVVREPSLGGPRRGIVVGVDGSDASGAALRWAVAEGRWHQQPVQAIHARHVQLAGADPLAMTVNPGASDGSAQLLIDTAVAGVDDRDLPSPIERTLVDAGGARALVEASATAELLVIGNRGHSSLALGSVAQQSLHHALCPVALIPVTARESSDEGSSQGPSALPLEP